jgi:DNA-binding MarR family transcriptional regulator
MAEINEMIHQPIRLKVMAALFALESDAEVDFTFLRTQLQLTDGNLGAHLEKLEAASYLAVRKAFVGRKPKTFLRLTRTGRRAFEDYVEALRDVIAAAPDVEEKLAEKKK